MHGRLSDIPAVRDAAAASGRRLFDIRLPDRNFSVGTGAKRPGKRLLPVGTDCSVGKMYTALAFEREMQARSVNAHFRATGHLWECYPPDGSDVTALGTRPDHLGHNPLIAMATLWEKLG